MKTYSGNVKPFSDFLWKIIKFNKINFCSVESDDVFED